MKTDLEGLRPCASFTETCVESHGAQCQLNEDQSVGAPSFLKMIRDKHLPNNAGFVVSILCSESAICSQSILLME